MTRDRNDIEELAHDTSGASDRAVEACMAEAMDDLVYEVMSGEKIGCPQWGLHDFIREQEDICELAASVILNPTGCGFVDTIESRLREYLADTETLYDRAVEIANEGSES